MFVTSGLPNADFPGDIPVATVVSTATAPPPPQETVALQPSADLSHLRYVSVGPVRAVVVTARAGGAVR